MVCIHNKQTRLDDIFGHEIRTYLGGIPDSELMRMLNISDEWNLVSTSIQDYPEGSASKGRIVFSMDIEHGRKWPCPNCGKPCGVHAYETRVYQTVPILGHQTLIKAQVPKLRCESCNGYPQIQLGWARPDVSYTIEFERKVMTEMDDRPVISTAIHLDTSDFIVYDIVKYRVGEALERMDLSMVSTLYIDETSFKKGHKYITVICDQFKRIVFMCEGRDSSAVDRFNDWLVQHRGRPENIRVVSCDMGLAYPAGVRRNFPEAVIVFDKFHVIKLVSEAFDKYYGHTMATEDLKAARNFLRYTHMDDFSDKQRMMFELIENQHSELAEAYRMKEVLFSMYSYADKQVAADYFDIWVKTVKKGGPKELVTAAESLEKNREGILMWYDHSVNNGLCEGMNSLIQTTKRIARGYRNVNNFIAMCYLRNGHLDIRF